MRYFLELGLFLLILLGIYALFTVLKRTRQTPSRKIKKALYKILSAMQKDYLNFIDKKINLEIINNDSLYIDKEKLAREALRILRPHVDALWAFVNSNYSTETIDLNKDLGIFSSLLYQAQRSLKHGGELPDSEYLKLEKSVANALEADITKRMMQLGNV